MSQRKLTEEYCKETFGEENIKELNNHIKKCVRELDYLSQSEKSSYTRNIKKCIFDIAYTFQDNNSEEMGFILWDYDFYEFIDRPFSEALDLWLSFGTDRGYNVEYINTILKSGGMAGFEECGINTKQLQNDINKEYEQAIKSYSAFVANIL